MDVFGLAVNGFLLNRRLGSPIVAPDISTPHPLTQR